MPALHGAVALPEVDAVAEPVDGDLDLDVPVVLQPALEVEGVVAERRAGLGPADRQDRGELARGAHHAHALAAAPRGGLDQHRIADPLGLLEGVGLVAQQARARDGRQAVRGEQPAGLLLGREAFEHVRGRADEGEPVGADGVGERVVLRQEAVARVDGVAAGHERGGDERGCREVRAPRVGRADADGLVGEHRAAATRGRPPSRRRRPRSRPSGTRAGSGARSRPGSR